MQTQNHDPIEEVEGEQASSGVAVLDRAFALLNAFGTTDNQLSLTELSRRTKLYKSTVLRLLAALEHGGFIRKTAEGLYAIGPQPMRLAAIYQRSFQVDDVILPLLSDLSEQLGETASFYIRSGDRRVVVNRVEPTRSVRVSIRAGEDFELSKGASGKVLLAFTTGEGQESAAIQSRLWAYSLGERDGETASASVPVFGPLGEIKGALTVSGPLSRLGVRAAMFNALSALSKAAGRATQAFGGNALRYSFHLQYPSDVQFEIRQKEQ